MSVQKVKFGNKPQRQQKIKSILSKYVTDEKNDYLKTPTSTWNSHYVNGIVTINGTQWAIDIRISDHSQYGGDAEDYIEIKNECVDAEIYTNEAYRELINQLASLA